MIRFFNYLEKIPLYQTKITGGLPHQPNNRRIRNYHPNITTNDSFDVSGIQVTNKLMNTSKVNEAKTHISLICPKFVAIQL